MRAQSHTQLRRHRWNPRNQERRPVGILLCSLFGSLLFGLVRITASSTAAFVGVWLVQLWLGDGKHCVVRSETTHYCGVLSFQGHTSMARLGERRHGWSSPPMDGLPMSSLSRRGRTSGGVVVQWTQLRRKTRPPIWSGPSHGDHFLSRSTTSTIDRTRMMTVLDMNAESREANADPSTTATTTTSSSQNTAVETTTTTTGITMTPWTKQDLFDFAEKQGVVLSFTTMGPGYRAVARAKQCNINTSNTTQFWAMWRDLCAPVERFCIWTRCRYFRK
jgi:hypothetical protein